MLRLARYGFLMVILGMAVAVPSASAVSFHSQSNPEYLLGQQVESTKFRFPSTFFGLTILEPICTAGNGVGQTMSHTSAQIQLSPTYSGCTTEGVPLAIEMNGCAYTFTPAGAPPVFSGSLALTCPAGKAVVFKFFAGWTEWCQIIMPPQVPSESKFELLNEGPQVRLRGTAKGFWYTTKPESELINCRVPANDAELILDLVVKGYSDPARTKQVSFRVE